MSEEADHSPSVIKAATSILEMLVEARFLLLFLCFAFYVDIWLLKNGVDLTSLSLKNSYGSLLSISVFSLLLFAGSYSLLMVVFFPALRKLIGLARIYLQSEVHIEKVTADSKKLADWSLAFICLSSYDGILGYFFAENSYRGLAVYIITFLQVDGVVESIFRVCVILLWLGCLFLAFQVDEI